MILCKNRPEDHPGLSQYERHYIMTSLRASGKKHIVRFVYRWIFQWWCDRVTWPLNDFTPDSPLQLNFTVKTQSFMCFLNSELFSSLYIFYRLPPRYVTSQVQWLCSWLQTLYRPWCSILFSRPTLALYIFSLMDGIGYSGFLSGFPIYLRQVLKFDITQVNKEWMTSLCSVQNLLCKVYTDRK